MAEINDRPLYRHSGVAGVEVLRIAANVADTETVTIGDDTYEFDRAVDGVVSGNIAVTTHADDTPANATDALITAINTLGTMSVLAVDVSVNELVVFTANRRGGDIKGAAGSIAVSETMAGANNEWGGANIDDGRRFGSPTWMTTRVPTAQEVALGNMQFGVPFTPAHTMVQVNITGSGALKLWDGKTFISGGQLNIANNGAVDWAVTDTVTILAQE